MSSEIQAKVDKLRQINITLDVYLSQADVDIEVQGESVTVTVDDIEGEAETYLTATILEQLTDIELRWLVQTCRELRAAKE